MFEQQQMSAGSVISGKEITFHENGIGEIGELERQQAKRIVKQIREVKIEGSFFVYVASSDEPLNPNSSRDITLLIDVNFRVNKIASPLVVSARKGDEKRIFVSIKFESGEFLMNKKIHIQSLCGDGLNESFIRRPFVLPSGTRMTITFENLSPEPIFPELDFIGEKIRR